MEPILSQYCDTVCAEVYLAATRDYRCTVVARTAVALAVAGAELDAMCTVPEVTLER